MQNGEIRYAEDYRPGEVFVLGDHLITEDEMIEFASKYDPMPFHTDKEAARRSVYGGLTASGWHTGLIMLRLMYRGFICAETSLGAPGLDLTWLLPVRPGDCLRGQVEVHDVRVSKSRPEMGFVANTATLTNQNDELVYRVKNTAIFRTRPPGSGGGK